MTHYGPVEVFVVGFPGSKFTGAIAPALQAVVAKGDISIVDLAFVAKNEDGSVAIMELSDAQDDQLALLDSALEDVLGLLNEDDLLGIAESLEPGSSAAAIVFEHTWARALSAAVRGADGQVILTERIPRDVVEVALAAADAEQLEN